MDGDPSMPDSQGFWPIARVLAPFEGHVIGSGPNHGSEDQDGQQVGNERWGDAPRLAQSGGQG